MRDEPPRPPTPIHRKQRDRFLGTYDDLDWDEREIVQTFLIRWSFMERTRHERADQESVKVRVLGKEAS